MRPEENQDRRAQSPLVPQRSILHGATPPTRGAGNEHHTEAAANIARGQLSAIYSGNTTTPTPQTTPVPAEQHHVQQQPINHDSPYARTHHDATTVHAEQWKQYHSAWQDYYQKYYERYYIGQVYQAKQELEQKASEQPVQQSAPALEPESDSFSRDEAMYDLRQRLLGKIQDSGKKVRKSRHFVPITAALSVMLVFLFLQYNRVLFSNVQAYISPGNIDPANIIVNPETSAEVSKEPKLIIPKINVDVPVVYNTAPDHDSQMRAMENGVAYFGIPGANSKPGQVGNTVLSGHSSNDIVDSGNYKFIFARLDQLNKSDTVYVNYEGTRYTYTITKKEVVKPTEVNKLVYDTDKPMLTLITCTPLGTSLNRLLVTAEQVSPSPTDAQPAPDTNEESENDAAMPGNSPTFVQRIFGGGDE